MFMTLHQPVGVLHKNSGTSASSRLRFTRLGLESSRMKAGPKLPSGFAEVPHMGTALAGSSPSWTEAAEQLARRVNWDLGAEPVEFRALDSLAGGDRASTLRSVVGYVIRPFAKARPAHECKLPGVPVPGP